MTGTYPPIGTLKLVAENVWIVDGPIIRFGLPFAKMPFPTRMTILRLEGGKLLIHSPTELTDSLKREVASIGEPAFIIGPNRIHYWWVPDWAKAWPEAEVWLAPRIEQQAKGRIAKPFHLLERKEGYPWDVEVATLPVAGSYMTEVEFFHRASRTLILTDFIENFEGEKLGSGFMRLLCRLGGVLAPHGGMPRDMRASFHAQKKELKAAIETMIAWNPERIVIAHGKWFETGGAEALRRSYTWLLT
jgi:hypothetical protein